MKTFYMKILFSFLVLSVTLPLTAQTFGNEWINYNQTYFKFPITEDGVYKITYADLQPLNIESSAYVSENLQIYGRDRQIPIYVSDGGNNQIDSGDFIAFYAQKNDGWLDETIYKDPKHLSNPYFSIYNDTIYYFLSWNTSGGNLRYEPHNNPGAGLLPEIPYLWWSQHYEFHDFYFEGYNIGNLSTSYYNPGEGFCSGNYGNNGSNNPQVVRNFNTKFPYSAPGGPNAKLRSLSMSKNRPTPAPGSSYSHHLRYSLGTQNFVLLDTLYIDITSIYLDKEIPISELNTNTTALKWQIVNDIGIPLGQDLQGIGYFAFQYPRIPNLDLPNGNSAPAHGVIEIDAFAGEHQLNFSGLTYASPLILLQGDNPQALDLTSTGSNQYRVAVPDDGQNQRRKIIYADANRIKAVPTITPVTASGKFTNFNNVPDSALIMVYPKVLKTGAEDYQSYRESAAGGNHNVVSAEAEELYLQFGGGIPKHINGIRRFAHSQYENSSIKPSGLFLIGKGVREAIVYNFFTSGANGTRVNQNYYNQNLVPSFGQPSSDIAITASLIPNNWAPLIPTGRISVLTNQELSTYLSKVVEFENQQGTTLPYNSPTKDWQKHVLHFGGGTTATEQQVFQGYLNSMEQTIENSLFAGTVTKLYKTGSDPFDPVLYSEISDRLSSGVSLINFFGHANPQTSGFEINIDNPENWNNKGRYPMVLANTCHNGNIFTLEGGEKSVSEDFVRAPNSGSIGFISSVYLSYSNSLGAISSNLYKQLADINYGKPIGYQMMRSASALQASFSGTIYEANTLQYTLNGDPMVRVNFHEKPEIEIRPEFVGFSPTNFDLSVDSITIEIKLRNLGSRFSDTFQLEITRDFPNSNIDSVYSILIPGMNYEHQVTLKIPSQLNIGSGLNKFSFVADVPSFVDEVFDEITNNRITKNLLINTAGIQPVLPTDYAVVDNPQITLKASTINVLADLSTYRFEIDTTDEFNSPFHKYQEITSSGGIVSAEANQWISTSSNQVSPLNCTDSTAYFWRVKLNDGIDLWHERSFQYIVNKTGWGQDHFFQFKNNSFNGLEYDRIDRTKEFSEPDSSEITVEAYGTNYSFFAHQWSVNGQQQDYGMCENIPQIQVGVFDPCAVESWGTAVNGQNPDNSFGNYNDGLGCRDRVEKFFLFKQNSLAQLTNFQNMILNEIPDSMFVVIYFPRHAPQFDSWKNLDSAGMFGLFEQIGSTALVADTQVFHGGMIFQKGNPSSLVELFTTDPNAPVKISAYAKGCGKFGTEVSTLIGPVQEWKSLHTKWTPTESGVSTDSIQFEIDLFNSGAQYVSTMTLSLNRDDSIVNLSSLINGATTPYIRLTANYEDTTNGSPPILDRWHVLFNKLPEAAIDPSEGYYLSANIGDTLNTGETVSMAFDIRNIDDIDMDSLLVSYYVSDANNNVYPIPYSRQAPLLVGETLRDTISIETKNLRGENVIWMEVNPFDNAGIKDQAELYHFNNLLQIPIHFNEDNINPILDVTFDGRHILNGDIVNPKSEIIISLKDENEFLIMDDAVEDTSLFGLYLTKPDGQPEPIYFYSNGVPNLTVIPGNSSNNKFKIIYNGEFTEDGIYELLVQGADKSENLSGDYEYRVQFEVVNESTITQMMNYPNPFTTSTRFVFTLTGSQIPDDLMIQIMTMKGTVVKTITEQEFGRIHIGRNISEYAWDGTDEFGDRLANGVYLYRVMMRMDGDEIKLRESGADQYFEHSFGKMYLMR